MKKRSQRVLTSLFFVDLRKKGMERRSKNKLDITVQFRLTEGYYKQALKDIIDYRTRFRKRQILIAVLFFLIAIFLMIVGWLEILPRILFYGGIFMTFMGMAMVHDYYSFQKKWMTERVNNKLFGKVVTLIFKEEKVFHEGPYTKGEMLWTGFANVTKTQNGLIMVPQNGISIYVPKSSFAEEQLFEEAWDKIVSIL